MEELSGEIFTTDNDSDVEFQAVYSSRNEQEIKLCVDSMLARLYLPCSRHVQDNDVLCIFFLLFF